MPQLAPVSAVLGITDQKWSAPRISTLPVPGARFSYNEMGALYRTAHLIIYYFLQLEGEKGISKLQRYVSLKQEKFDEMLAYRAAFDEYERKMEDFLKLPGVEKLADGRIRYPSNLTLPDTPKPPAGAAGAFESSGMEILFDGETPEVLGSKIEEALIKDLGLQLRFRLAIGPK